MFVDVGPELSEHKDACIDANVEAPLASGVSQAPRCRGVIEIGDSRGCARAHHLTDVESFLSGICSGDDCAAQSVAGALHESSVAERVVARVFAGDGGKNKLDHV